MIQAYQNNYKRIHHSWIPRRPCLCEESGCVYAVQGCCLDPHNNHGNSDALCYHENHHQLLDRLTLATPTECAPARAAKDAENERFWTKYPKCRPKGNHAKA